MHLLYPCLCVASAQALQRLAGYNTHSCLSCLLSLAGGGGRSGSGGHSQGEGAGAGGNANSGSLWWKILLAVLAVLLAVAVISTNEPEEKGKPAK